MRTGQVISHPNLEQGKDALNALRGGVGLLLLCARQSADNFRCFHVPLAPEVCTA
jgi:hypothetical protein